MPRQPGAVQGLSSLLFGIFLDSARGQQSAGWVRCPLCSPSRLTQHGALKQMQIAPAAAGSLAWLFAQANGRDFFVDFQASRPPMVDRWLAEPTATHFIW